jgi:hypothetical protein
VDERGINGLMDSPVEYEVGGREIRGVLGREMRLLITGSDGNDMTLGPDLERDLMWVGDMSVPSDISADERMEQSQQQMDMMTRSEIELGARRHVSLIKPTADGYGILMRVVGNRNIPESGNGRHFVELTLDGVRREIYLDPIGDELDVQFERFAAAADGTVYLYARGSGSSLEALILPIDDSGARRPPLSFSLPDYVQMDRVFAAPSGLWLIGHGAHPVAGIVSPWIRQIDYSDFDGV